MANAPSSNSAKTRLLIFGGIMFGWMLLIGIRLVYLQIYRYGDFVKQAARQQQRTVEVSPRRGVVYDRNGQELAMSVPVDSVFAVPSEIPDQETTASILAKVTGADPQDLLAKIKAGRNFAWIARKVDGNVSNRIRALNLRGIYFEKESKRYYPKRELAAQVLGFVGTDDEGLAGIERQFEDKLRGEPGTMMISQDARRRWFGRVERQPDPGENVVLTIDEKIQYIVEKELERAMTETGAVAGTVVVQNPRTGEILALANRPTFNPNLSREITPAVLKNHAVSDVYEPGSVFKTVTYSSVLEDHLARPDEMVDCNPGYIMVGGIRIRDSHHVGMVTLDKAYAESSDVGAVKMGLRLGPDRFYKYIRDYGFGQQTGIELPGETRGLVKPPARWSAASIGSMSIGQEVGVTPLQIVSMVSAIANDGIYTSPRIVAGVTNPQNGYQQIVFHPANPHRVISTMTAAQMRHFMELVVLDGTARRAILDGYTSAGKTGTAQKVDPRTHTYSHTDYVGSFVGFAPVNSPALTVAVILDSAKGLHQGGQVSAPVFKRVAEQVLAYMHVPHDVEPKVDFKRQLLLAQAKETDIDESLPHSVDDRLDIPDVPSEPARPVNANASVYRSKEKGVMDASFTPAPAAQSHNAAPVNNAPLPQPDRHEVPHPSGTVVLDVASGQVVPEFLGKPLRVAVQLAQQSGVELQVIGSGVAREQSPAPGTRVPAGSKVAVRFTR
jgi:cell division protein FtsI (penicillin-binding protein 3)